MIFLEGREFTIFPVSACASAVLIRRASWRSLFQRDRKALKKIVQESQEWQKREPQYPVLGWAAAMTRNNVTKQIYFYSVTSLPSVDFRIWLGHESRYFEYVCHLDILSLVFTAMLKTHNTTIAHNQGSHASST